MQGKPYATYADCPASEECDYCPEGAEYGAGHSHYIYETQEGARAHTGDELADIFLDAVEFYAAPWKRPDGCPRDVVGWLDDPDASQWLHDCVADGESALADAGGCVYWDDGYVIERIEASRSECRHCGRVIECGSDGIWRDPDATGDDSVWSETCDAHDTLIADHEPRGM